MVDYDVFANLVITTTDHELKGLVAELGRPVCSIDDEQVQDLTDAASGALIDYAKFVETPKAANHYLKRLDETMRLYEEAV